MTKNFSLSPSLTQLEQRINHGIRTGLQLAGELLRSTAAGYIGQELPDWPPLAASTVAEKTRLGFTGKVSLTDPLLRTGALQASLTWSLDTEKMELRVGSSDPVAIWQELGTATIPPRSFLARAAIEQEQEIRDLIAGEIAKAIRND